MNILKRLGLAVFALCAGFSLAALALTWFGPWTEQARGLLAESWYYLCVEVALGVTGVGALAMLLSALFAPRRRKVIEVAHFGSDAITVTTDAIASQATRIIERDGAYSADRVRVNARRSSVSVFVRVSPLQTVNVIERGAELHESLMQGIALLVGDALTGVDIEYAEASSPFEAQGFAGVEASTGNDEPELEASLRDLPPSQVSATRGGITVSVDQLVPEEVAHRVGEVE